MKNIVYAGLLFILFGCNVSNKEKVDMVFLNGKVYTVNESQPWAEAVAVNGNKIVFVGSSEDAKAYIGDETEVKDLEGKMILPGFISGHDHLIASNWTKAGVNLFGVKSKEEYLSKIKAYAGAHPEDEFVFGYGWDRTVYGGYPTAKELDEVVPDRPAMIFDFTIHDLWFNTKALVAGKVTKDTPDPQPGFSYWRRDSEGNPEGVGVEVPWMQAYITSGAWQREQLMTSSQSVLFQIAAEQGFTAVINQGLVTPNFTNLPGLLEDYQYSFEMLEDLDEAGKLILRTFQQIVYKDPNAPVSMLIDGTKKFHEQYNSDRLRVSGVKIHPEGNWNSYTSLMLEPWADKPGEYGKAGVSPERVMEIVLAANESNFDVSVHVDGSATTRTTIDAFEESINAGYKDARNSLQHYHNVHPIDQERTIDLDLAVNSTPLFGTDWSNTDQQALQILGQERINTSHMPYIEAIRAGVRVSLSGDVPSSPPAEASALINIEASMTLCDPSNEKSEPFLSGVGISLEQAIKTLTIDPAWQARMEDKIGSIEVGKYADMVILEQNLFDVAPKDIASVQVLATMMDGKYTFKNVEGTALSSQSRKDMIALATVLRVNCCETSHYFY